jgi:hypothetical protein
MNTRGFLHIGGGLINRGHNGSGAGVGLHSGLNHERISMVFFVGIHRFLKFGCEDTMHIVKSFREDDSGKNFIDID